jgi:flagella basal body P-ring formation protein FlgA
MAETAVFRAPAPGTAGVLSVEDIAAALRSAGIEEFQAAGLDTIRVARVGVEVGLPLITDLIATDLRTRGILSSGMDMDIALDTPLPELVSANTANPATLTILRYMPGSSTFSARFQIGGIDRPLDVSGQIQLLIAAPHLTRTLPQGTILSPDDVEMRMIPLPYAESAGLVAVEQLVGKALQRQTRAGVMLRPSDIAAPEIISRNEQVTVVYQHGSLTLTTTGNRRALIFQPAALGEARFPPTGKYNERTFQDRHRPDAGFRHRRLRHHIRSPRQCRPRSGPEPDRRSHRHRRLPPCHHAHARRRAGRLSAQFAVPLRCAQLLQRPARRQGR